MRAPGWRVRATVLLLAGAVAVHRAVYALAGVRPDEHAHAYLDWLTPALVALLFAGVAEVAVRALRVHRRPAAPPPRARVLWPMLSAALVAIFVAQEAGEALLTRGHGHGHELAVAELLLSHGAWAAAPVALAIGALLALALRGAAAADAWSLALVPPRPAAPAPLVAPLPRAAALGAPRDVLARNLAGRGPPVAVA